MYKVFLRKPISMKNAVLFFLSTSFFFLALNSCKKENLTDDTFDRFNGKYEILSAKANYSVDINMDGSKSSELLNEIPNLSNSWLELRIINHANLNLLDQMWPEQMLIYSSDTDIPIIDYIFRSTPFAFDFDKDFSNILVDTLNIAEKDKNHSILPRSIHILDDEIIVINFTKKLYTSEGWKLLEIESRYKRWTSAT